MTKLDQIIPLPRTTRELLLGFLLYDESEGLPSIVRQIDFSGATRRHILAITANRLPGHARQLVEPAGFSARRHFVKGLSGRDFQTRIRELVLDAFPEKRRVINIHIAKCAGTDLELSLKRRYPFLHHILSIPEATPVEALFKALHLVALGLPFSDAIAVSGHVELSWYLKAGLIRAQDEVITAVREPRERIYSQISYMLSTMAQFSGTPRFDTAGWMAAIGMQEMPAEPGPGDLLEIGRRLLRCPAVVRPNMMCEMLGNRTAESAIENLVVGDVEITDMARYSAWRTARFEFAPGDRINQSQPLFTAEMADAADRDVVDGLIDQDILLYEAVRQRLEAGGGLSVRGRVFG